MFIMFIMCHTQNHQLESHRQPIEGLLFFNAFFEVEKHCIIPEYSQIRSSFYLSWKERNHHVVSDPT